MSRISITTRGSFDNIERFLRKSARLRYNIREIMHKYGPIGVQALRNATPVDSGLSAELWHYEVVETKSEISLQWHNTNIVGSIPVVILLEYGHGTRSGGFVPGHDFIMPAITPILEQIQLEIEREVTK